jgi:hypothetical protein
MFNGFTTTAILIKCSVSQGCRLIKLLFALIINLLLHKLDQDLHVYQYEEESPEITCIAYTDDVSVTHRSDIEKLRNILENCKRAAGAALNQRKSKALPLAGRDITHDIISIPYVQDVQILGIQ